MSIAQKKMERKVTNGTHMGKTRLSHFTLEQSAQLISEAIQVKYGSRCNTCSIAPNN